LQALHRVREPLVSQRTGIINQIRAFLLERGIAVRQGLRFLRSELPTILSARSDVLSSRMMRVIEDLNGDWRRLDERTHGWGVAAHHIRRRAGDPAWASCKGVCSSTYNPGVRKVAQAKPSVRESVGRLASSLSC
jgi:transposase